MEVGAPTVAIGTVFELATILDIDLFGAVPCQLPEWVMRARDRLVLFPARVRESAARVDDAF